MTRPALPKSLRRIHLVAIGGTGMGSLAGLLHARGYAVSGSDRALYPPMSEALESWGIPVAIGFDAQNVLRDPPDLVVIGNAVSADNPEARAAIDNGIPYRSFPDALYELAMAGRHAVVIAGTHGKTTTTTLVAALLLATGRDPSLLVGGISANFDGPFRIGAGEHFVVEGDEYDTAFFDKTPKFWHYHPRTLLLTSLEFDHADIYRDLEHVKSVFRTLLEGMPSDGRVIAARRDTVREVCRAASCAVEEYGLGENGTGWCARDIEVGEKGTRFSVWLDGRRVVRAQVPMFGDYNIENALGALALVHRLGVPVKEAADALERFEGIRRRQELRGEVAGVTVIDDFAHHPTAVRETVRALRGRYPGRRLVAAFEPRSNTSRRAIFQDAYVEALRGADRVVLAHVPPGPLYSATGEVTEFFDAGRAAQALRERGVDAEVREGGAAIATAIAARAERGDVVLVMSNGDFDGLCGRLLDSLAA